MPGSVDIDTSSPSEQDRRNDLNGDVDGRHNFQIDSNVTVPSTPGTPGRASSVRSTSTRQQNHHGENIVPDSGDGMSSPGRNVATSPYIGKASCNLFKKISPDLFIIWGFQD